MRCYIQKSINDNIYLKNAINWTQPGERCYCEELMSGGQYWTIGLKNKTKLNMHGFCRPIQGIKNKATCKFNIRQEAKQFESD